MTIVLIVILIRTDPIVQTQVSALDQRLEDKGVRLLIAICMVALINMVTAGHAKAQQPGWAPQSWVNQGGGSGWWVEVGAAAFDRPSEDLGLSLITNSLTNEVLLSAQDVTDLETSFGANVAFGGTTRGGRQWVFESTIVNWDEVHQILGPNISTPFTTESPDQIDVGYDSDLYSIELGTRRVVAPGISLMAGPRYMRVEELLRLETQTLVTDFLGPFLIQTRDDIEVSNSMIGLQMGVEFNQPIGQLLTLQGYTKVGGYTNRAEYDRMASDNLGGDPTVESLGKSTGSFVGEVGAKAYFDVVPGTVKTFFGYEATWIDGIALAPAQTINFGDLDLAVETTNTVFFQQFTFGFTILR